MKDKLKHAWVIQNKDFGGYVYKKTRYIDDINLADVFPTRQKARDFIHSYDTVEEEKPVKVYFHGKKIIPESRSGQLFLF